MAETEGGIEQRTQKALATIHDAYASPGDEDSVTLFVTHHLEHIEADLLVEALRSRLAPTRTDSRSSGFAIALGRRRRRDYLF